VKISALSVLFSAFALFAGLQAQAADLIVRAQQLYTISGPVVKNAVLVVEKGRIKEIASEPFKPPAGVPVISAPVVMPGIIDASSRIGLPPPINEESSEITPCVKAADVFDPSRKEVTSALWRGVTLAHIEPGERNVVGGLCALVRTCGKTRKACIVNRAASLKAALGSKPTLGNRGYGWGPPRDMFFRRPTTRMAVIELFRRALRYGKEAADKKKLSPREAVLRDAVQGKLPLRVYAGSIIDIRAALREKKRYEFRLVLENGWEAYKAADRLAAQKIPVVLDPNAAGMLLNLPPGGKRRLDCASELAGRGVPLAFGSFGLDIDLRLVAATAVRYGLSEKQALRALTLGAAEAVGAAGEWGSIAPGKRADLVLLNGPPLSAATSILKVVCDGRVVYPPEGGQ